MCPRCFYVSKVLGIEPPESDEIRVGNIAHGALETFYRRWRNADAEGAPRPGLAELLRIGRTDFKNALNHESRGSEDDLDQLLAQLRLTFEHLHNDQDHVLELERLVNFQYESAHGTHQFVAKIDRLDRPRVGNPGAYRIIDYKTGKAHKYLTEPKTTDLQMGIYTMAIQSIDPDWDGTGRAEYWCLATGERGVLDLATLDHAKIRKEIDDAIAEMLAGNFPKSKRCPGHCDFLGDDAKD
jgi:RecB family exonuclease